MSEANGSGAGAGAIEQRGSADDRGHADREFRQRVRSVVRPLSAQFDRWERDGHIPRWFFERLGERSIFADRWRDGPVQGHHLGRILVEELTPLNGGVALAVSIHSEVFIHALALFGGAARDGLLRDALAGRAIGCFAATEPTAGSDLTAITTTAVGSGDGWRLSGQKRYTTNAGSATHVLILANVISRRPRPSLFCLPAERVELLGFYQTLGVRSADTCALSIDTQVGAADLVGKPGHGLGIAFQLLDFERLAAAAGLVAGAEITLRLARAWARRRTQSAVRLFDHQALSHRLADRWADLYAARAALNTTCERLATGSIPHVEIAATKLLAARAASLAVDETLQIFGARGYTTAFPIERMYRDVRLTRIGGGSDEVMRNIVAAYLDTEDPEASAWVDGWQQADDEGRALIGPEGADRGARLAGAHQVTGSSRTP